MNSESWKDAGKGIARGIRLAAPSVGGRGRNSFYADTRRLVDELVRTLGATEHNFKLRNVNSDDRCACTDKPSAGLALWLGTQRCEP